jgi:hypothetical protein
VNGFDGSGFQDQGRLKREKRWYTRPTRALSDGRRSFRGGIAQQVNDTYQFEAWQASSSDGIRHSAAD